MKRARKLVSVLLAIIMVLALAVPALAAEGDFVIEDGVLTEYHGPVGDVVIPAGVTGIGHEAFLGRTGLTGVTIPDGVTTIGDAAFAGCTGLTGITIPDSVTYIGYAAFQECFSLAGITIPDSVATIGYGAFLNCSSLTSVTIPASVATIEQGAFLECTGLTSFTIPNSVTIIEAQAFEGCTGLTNVTIPDSVTGIWQFAFSDCTGLTSVTIPASVTTIGSYAFRNCTGLTDVYYGGTEAQWNAVDIGYSNDPLVNATIHFSSADPAAKTAYASTQNVNVDGKSVEFQCYALKDENGNMTNYIKLRDLANILNGSAAQFRVGWDGSVTITTGSAYTPNGSEGSTPYSGDRAYQEAAAVTKVNGQAAAISAFVLNDDDGGGYTYYQLRDLGQALGFNVGWSADRGIFIETDKPYDPAN